MRRPEAGRIDRISVPCPLSGRNAWPPHADPRFHPAMALPITTAHPGTCQSRSATSATRSAQSSSENQRRRATNFSRKHPRWAIGPPNEVRPSRRNVRKIDQEFSGAASFTQNSSVASSTRVHACSVSIPAAWASRASSSFSVPGLKMIRRGRSATIALVSGCCSSGER